MVDIQPYQTAPGALLGLDPAKVVDDGSLRELLRESFLRGVVLHGGLGGASFGQDLVVLPLESRWRG